MNRPGIWLGDLVRAVTALGVTEPWTRQRVADLLGFETRARVAPPGTEEEGTSSDLPTAAPAAEGRLDKTRDRGSVDDLPDLGRLPEILPLMAAGRTGPPVEPLTLSEAPVSPPFPPPLLDPLASRFTAKALVTSVRYGPEVDIPAVVGRLSRLEAPDPMPLERRLTLARGVQVLVDTGEGCEPFVPDQEMMVQLLRRLVGESLVEVSRIYEAPRVDDELDPWEPPAPGTTVLALTDLGLSGRSDQTEEALSAAWLEAADLLASRGSELIALVPYPPSQWIIGLQGPVRIVMWDRSTTVSVARLARERTT